MTYMDDATKRCLSDEMLRMHDVLMNISELVPKDNVYASKLIVDMHCVLAPMHKLRQEYNISYVYAKFNADEDRRSGQHTGMEAE